MRGERGARAIAAALCLTAAAPASFHFMQIEQVVGGVAGDTAAQAVQLRMRTTFQCFLTSGAELWVRDARGENPVLLIDFDEDLPGCEIGDHVLVVSEGLAAHTDEPPAADFLMQNQIPAGYLAAGTMTFEDELGVVYWRLSWGGDAYTGPTGGAIDNDPDGEFGPPFPAPLPSEGAAALQFQGRPMAPSSTNADDYAVTVTTVILTGNACASVRLGKPCPWDCACAPDGEVGIADVIAILASWGSAGTCDLDGGGTGITDLLAVLSRWGTCP